MSVREISRSIPPAGDAKSADALRIFAGGLAHAFSNVLSGVIGYAQLTKEDLADPVAAAAHLDDLLKASQRARQILDQVLAFSRVQQGAPRELSLVTFVEERLPRWRASVPSNIEITSRSVDCAPVFADPDQLEQAVGCLLANATRAIGNQPGQIEIALAPDAPAPIQAAPLASDAAYVCLSVRDNGTGIQADIVEQIFEPFFTTLPMGRGVGLGLAIVEAIVAAAGGVVRAETAPGQGAAFHLFFPAHR